MWSVALLEQVLGSAPVASNEKLAGLSNPAFFDYHFSETGRSSATSDTVIVSYPFCRITSVAASSS